MADGEKRIIELEELTTLTDNDYIAVDNSASGGKTKKFKPKNLQDATNQVLKDVAYMEWENTDYYIRGDIVAYEGYLYVCKVDEATYGSFVSSDWKKTYVERWGRDLFFDISSQEMTFSDSEYTLPYSKGDVVYRYYSHPSNDGFQMRFYVAKADYPNGVTEYVASQWDEYYSLSEVIQALTQELADEKANTEGSYDKLTVGLSHNVIGDSYEVDTAPYLYRPSKDGSAVEEEIVGGTVAWNQLVQNGNFASTTNWSASGCSMSASNNKLSVTFSSPANNSRVFQSIDTKANHVYFSQVVATSTTATGIALYNGTDYILPKTTVSTRTTLQSIGKTTANGTYFIVYVNRDATVSTSDTVTLENIQLVDLTQMFGSTIADYVYSLEQATAGSGVAWFRKYFPSVYYAYQSGKLESVNVASRKIVGKNLFDDSPNWKNGYYLNALGVESSNSEYKYTQEYFRVESSTTYTISINKNTSSNIGVTVCLYDSNKQFLERKIPITGTPSTGRVNGLLITTERARYIRISLPIASNDYQLELGSTATQYEPYTTKSYTLNTGELRGLFKLDANNNLVADGDVRKSDSKNTRYGIVDLGSLSWTYSSTSGHESFYSSGISSLVAKPADANTKANIICSKYITLTRNNVYNHNAGFGIAIASTDGTIYIYDSAYTDATAFKNSLDGVYLVYELATPTTESATPFENPQLVFSGGTEEFIDGATRDVAIPVGQNSKYYLDIKGKVEQLYGIPEPPSTNGTYKLICTVSSGVKTYSWVSN